MVNRRLSFSRVLIAILTTVLVVSGCFLLVQKYSPLVFGDDLPTQWYAGYVDVTATPSYAFESVGIDTTGNASKKNVVLSFIVSSTSDGCEPSWGTYYSLDEAKDTLEIDRKIARLKQEGALVAISFGGQANSELANTCEDIEKLADAYLEVIDRYEIDLVDFDIEGEDLHDFSAMYRRFAAIQKVAEEKAALGEDLEIWLTLPVSPSGLTSEGLMAVTQALENGVELAGVNAMTMNFGESKTSNESLSSAAKSALVSLHGQLQTIYEDQGGALSEQEIWRKIGATPMVGQTDIKEEVLTLDEATSLKAFLTEKGVGRISIWSANRDQACGENYSDLTKVSDSCSGVFQENQEYAAIFSEGTQTSGSSPMSGADREEQSSNQSAVTTDDPATSPYPIWNEEASYTKGFKVVWRQNVYQAKWWNSGEVPDNPVADEADTPWTLLGPVLEGETPAQQAEISEDLAEKWNGTNAYESGSIVYFDNSLYRAKWWTQGDSPAAAAFDPGGSPWQELTAREVSALIDEKNTNQDDTDRMLIEEQESN